MSFFTELFQMLTLLIIIGGGWLAAVRHMLDEYANSQISSMIVSILNSAFHGKHYTVNPIIHCCASVLDA